MSGQSFKGSQSFDLEVNDPFVPQQSVLSNLFSITEADEMHCAYIETKSPITTQHALPKLLFNQPELCACGHHASASSTCGCVS